jgi:hypothetical protein
MPGQRRVALPSRHFPNFHAFVVAATGHVFTIWAETNTVDRPVKRSIVSRHHTFEKSRSKRQRSSTRSARSGSTGIQKCQPSLLPISLLFYRGCRWQAWCRRYSMIQSGHCVFDEMCQHTKQLRQGTKIRFFFLISPI